MKKKVVLMTVLAFCALSLIGCGTSKDEVDALNSRIEELEAENAALKGEDGSDTTEGNSEATSQGSVTKDDISKKIDDIDNLYLEVIELAEGYTANPDTYTTSAYARFWGSVSDISTELSDLQEMAEIYGKEKYEEEFEDETKELTYKSLELSEALNKLPEDTAE